VRQANATLESFPKTEPSLVHPADVTEPPRHDKANEESVSAKAASSRAEKPVTPANGPDALRQTGSEDKKRELQGKERKVALGPALHNSKAPLEPARAATALHGGPGKRQNQISIGRIEVQVNNQVQPSKSAATVLEQQHSRHRSVDVQFISRFSLKP